MLLSGPADRDARLFLQLSKNLPVFTAAADDDPFFGMVPIMQWLFSVSPNPVSTYAHYAHGGHGADMFAANKELPDIIAEWFAATLTNNLGSAPKTNGSPLGPQVVRTLELVDQPGGAIKVAEMLEQARKSDPKAVLFPEFNVDLLSYGRAAARRYQGRSRDHETERHRIPQLTKHL